MRRIILFVVGAVLSIVAMCSCMSTEYTPSHGGGSDTLNAWVEIDTAQFRKNIVYLKSIMGGSTKVCVVMKGDAYGNGISLLMPSVISEGIENVAITSNQEARDVRESGYKGHIIRIRLATDGEIREGIDLGIEELIGNIEQARYINYVAGERGCTINYHLAINANGMSRNGIELKDGYGEALEILQLENLHCVGMMTHYPASLDGEIIQQLETFKTQTSELIRRGGLDRSELTLHTAATYAALYVPQTRMDMVRIGSALYNYGYTSKYNQFKPLLSFKSRVTSVQYYPAGNTVSYKRTRKLTRASRLANIPVGYANGISRYIGNKGYMLIRGHKCPVVGAVTMNITMVDVTDYPDIQAGDEVVIYGKQGNASITSANITAWTGTNLLSQTMFWASANPKIAK